MQQPQRKLDPRQERRRRRRILLQVVPGLLNRHLAGPLGWRRWPFILGMLLRARSYRNAFARPSDDAGLREVKRTFLLVGVLYNRLRATHGEELAFTTTYGFLLDLANAVQRQAYLPEPGAARTWEWFHREHDAQMEEGFIRNNENDGVVHTPDRVSLHITRCRFFEAFRDMGHAGLTEAFCRSDEMVFNEISPQMRFHRGKEIPNTIARGASRCIFIYENQGRGSGTA
jgi:hypothetical protein